MAPAHNRKLPDDETLRRHYHKEGLGIREIAERYGTTHEAVRQLLSRFGIKRREPIAPEVLRHLYVELRLTGVEIAERLGLTISQVKTDLARSGITRPTFKEIAAKTSKSDVVAVYITEGLTQELAAARLGINLHAFTQLLKKFRIQHRHSPGYPLGVPRKLTIDDESLRRVIVDEGRTALDLAELYGCSVDTVIRRLEAIGIRMRRRYNIHEEDLRRLYLVERQTESSIAEKYGCRPQVIRDRMKKYGIPSRGKPRKSK